MNRPVRLIVGLCALLSLVPVLGIIASSLQDSSWLLFCSGIIGGCTLILLWAMRAQSPSPPIYETVAAVAFETALSHPLKNNQASDLLPPLPPAPLEVETDHTNSEEATSTNSAIDECQILREKNERLEKSFEDCLEKQSQLIVELNSKTDEIHRLKRELEEIKQLKKQLSEQSELHLDATREELRQKEFLLDEYQQTIQKQLRQLAHLESKTRDQNYEIETLLMLSDGAPKLTRDLSQSNEDLLGLHVDTVKTAGEADLLLKRCIYLAQELPSSSHCGSIGARFRDLASDNDTLDLRRLFDRLRQEEGAILLFYSPQSEKLLFVHPAIKEVSGWTTDKFIQAFPDVIMGGIEEWKKQLAPLAKKAQVHTYLKIRNRSGNELLLNGCFSAVPQGIFKHQIMGVLYKGAEIG